MEDELAKTNETSEVAVAPVAEYEMHLKVPGEMEPTLKKSAQLAYKMGLIPNPYLTELVNLYIGWGQTILKKQWLDRMGYK